MFDLISSVAIINAFESNFIKKKKFQKIKKKRQLVKNIKHFLSLCCRSKKILAYKK
jgi:hypothetical protein